jgi:hypothetical protein
MSEICFIDPVVDPITKGTGRDQLTELSGLSQLTQVIRPIAELIETVNRLAITSFMVFIFLDIYPNPNPNPTN